MEEYFKDELDLFADPRFPVKLENLICTQSPEGKKIISVVRSLNNNSEYCKCPRCWNYHRSKENFDYLCDRCWPTLIKDYLNHPSVPEIKANIKAQRAKYNIKEEDCVLKID